MRSSIPLLVGLLATPVAAAEVPWGGVASRADAVLHAPDLADWMTRFDAAFGDTLRLPQLATQLAADRARFVERFGFDPYGPPPADLKAGPGVIGFFEGQPTEGWFPGRAKRARVGEGPLAGPEPDLGACVERDRAQLWVAAGLPGRTLDRGVSDCLTVRLEDVSGRTALHLDQTASSRGLGLLAPLFPRTPDASILAAVGADAIGLVRVRTAAAARGMTGPLLGAIPAALKPLFTAHYGDEFALVVRAEGAPRLLVRVREPDAARAALDALGAGWGGLRGATPFWGAAETPPVEQGHAAIHGEFLVIGSDASVDRPAQGRYALPPALAARAATALALVDLPTDSFDAAQVLAKIPRGAAPELDPAVLGALLNQVDRVGVAVGISEGRFWLRFRARSRAAARPGSAAGSGSPAAARPGSPAGLGAASERARPAGVPAPR